MKILLVAQPWKGGLGRYLYMAMQDMFPGEVEWLATRPHTLAERIKFRKDPEGWMNDIVRKVNEGNHRAAIFISHRPEFRTLKPNERNLLYVVDNVRLAPGDSDPFGRVFLADPGYLPDLLEVVPPSRYGGIMPFAHYPLIHRPSPYKGPKRDLCFIGNYDEKRDPYLAALFAKNMHARVYGNYFLNTPLFWEHPLSFRPAVPSEKMGRVYARYKVALNVHAQVVRRGTNMRTFECAGYGIPQVVEYREDLDRYFEPDKEILCFRNADEMIAQIQSLLADPLRASRMAGRARERALMQHSYHHRLAEMLHGILPPQELKLRIPVASSEEKDDRDQP